MNWIWTIIAALTVQSVAGDEQTHRYKEGDDVVLWMNTVGPRANRQETYEYYQLPYCSGSKALNYHRETLGEALQGMNLVNSGLEIQFRVPRPTGETCPEPSTLSQKQVKLFRYAVSNNYIFTAYVDDLPVSGLVGQVVDASSESESEAGESESVQLYVYTHRSFLFTYNGDRIISCNVTVGEPVLLDWEVTRKEFEISFTYSVDWFETSDPFNDRFDRYLESDFFEHKIHWFSIFNSIMIIVFLIVFVSIILLRALRHDIARYDKEEELGDLDRDLGDEYGWKLIHGDVFRAPSHLSILTGLVGTGYQLCFIAFFVILYIVGTDIYVERSSILTVSIVVYALSSIVSGYFSGAMYAEYGGKRWIRAMFVTAGLWPGVVSAIGLVVNTVAISYSSTKAIPFGTMVAVLAIWAFVVVPLTLLGTLTGRNWAGKADFPTRVNPIPRPIPEKNWHTEPISIVLMSGLLPFGSIFIEIYFVFTSFWAYNKVYYVYGFMFLVLIILMIVTACSTIVACYFLLNSEDHRWKWISFMSGGSVAIYVGLYSIHYFFARTKMYGLFQTVFYFGYTAAICFGLMMLCGAVGFFAANRFVRKIYSTVKID
eukprot:Partr_v1_DN26971_c0_g1_i4_m7332 putative transmembrane 9 superfamily member